MNTKTIQVVAYEYDYKKLIKSSLFIINGFAIIYGVAYVSSNHFVGFSAFLGLLFFILIGFISLVYGFNLIDLEKKKTIKKLEIVK